MPGPVKRSITIRGHRTSVSLEPVFWEQLDHFAEEGKTSRSDIVAFVDEERRENGENLSSALRVFCIDGALLTIEGFAIENTRLQHEITRLKHLLAAVPSDAA